MAYEAFDNDELHFDEWIRSHPFGVVVNSSPGGLNPKYIKAHRPECSSFHRHPGSKTVYTKHCFDSAEEAIQTITNGGSPKPSFGCRICKVRALEPTSDADQLNQRAQALLLKPFELPPAGNQSPERSTVAATRSVKRDPAVVAWVLRNANGTCELCSSIAPFFTSENRPYLEIHHVVTLASGGPDTVFNTVALCPNCHRAMHFSSARAALTEKLYHRTPRLQRS